MPHEQRLFERVSSGELLQKLSEGYQMCTSEIKHITSMINNEKYC